MSAKRSTIQKQVIYEAVNELKIHPSSDEIYEYVRIKYPNISRGTVFRNLKQMADNSEIKRVEVPNSADRFDFNCSDHYHMLCKECGRVYDVEIDYVSDMLSRIKDMNGFKIEKHDIVFKGICAKCNNK